MLSWLCCLAFGGCFGLAWRAAGAQSVSLFLDHVTRLRVRLKVMVELVNHASKLEEPKKVGDSFEQCFCHLSFEF